MIAYEVNGKGAESNSYVCSILSDETPSELPVVGDNVTGLSKGSKIAPGSVFMDLQAKKTYMMGESDSWFEL